MKRIKNEKARDELLDDFTNDDYIAIQTKLMLLRKYGTQNKQNSVYLKDVLECAKKTFKEYDIIIDSLVDKFEKVQKNEFETIFSDGSSLTLYNTIKYVMYGVYLHADPEKIESLLILTAFRSI